MTRSTRKKQEQLTLPELEPAFALEIQGEQPAADIARSTAPVHATKTSTARALPRNQHKSAANSVPRNRGGKIPRGAETRIVPQPETPAITVFRPPAQQPQLTYNRHDDSLRISILAEPVQEDCTGSQLSAGYTADGRLAEIRIFNLAHHVLSVQATVATETTAGATVGSETAGLLSGIRDELLFLKAGLALVLAGVLWLLLK